MRLRYACICAVCAAPLPARTAAVYNRRSKTVHCIDCVPGTSGVDNSVVVDARDEALVRAPDGANPAEEASVAEAGTAGASARREYERRKAEREDRIRKAHPKVGGLILALSDDPQSTRAWSQGAIGEERLGARLDGLAREGVALLHDRRIPGTKANIDHIAVTGNGVWVIDAKRYKGRPMLRVEGGILRPRVQRLLVGSRDCTKLVAGVTKQMNLVSEAPTAEGVDAPVHAALAFVDADWPFIGGAFTTSGVHVLWPKRLATLITESGELADRIPTIHGALARRFARA